MISNSRSVSRVVSDVVGSSKMMTLALAPSALAISTSWRSPCESLLTSVVGAMSRSTAASSSAARARVAPRSMKGSPATRFGKIGDEQVFGDAEIAEQVQFLVDEGDALPGRLARTFRPKILAVEDDAPGIHLVDAADDVHRRRLAGAVLADEPENPARLQREADVVQDLHAEEALAEPGDVEQRPRSVTRGRTPSPAPKPAHAAHQKPVTQRVDDGGGEDDAALDGEHRCDGQAHQLQALVDHGQEQDAEDGPQHLALAAEEADAADDGSADDVEQDALAEHRRARSPAGRCRGWRRSRRRRPK